MSGTIIAGGKKMKKKQKTNKQTNKQTGRQPHELEAFLQYLS